MLESMIFRETAICDGMVECPVLTIHLDQDPDKSSVKIESAIVLTLQRNKKQYAKLLLDGYEQNLARINGLFGKNAYKFQIPLSFLEKELARTRHSTDTTEEIEQQITNILKYAQIEATYCRTTFQYQLGRIEAEHFTETCLARVEKHAPDWYLLRTPQCESASICLHDFQTAEHAVHDWTIWREMHYDEETKKIRIPGPIIETGCGIMVLTGEPNTRIPEHTYRISFVDHETEQPDDPTNSEPQPFVVYEEFYGEWKPYIFRPTGERILCNILCKDRLTVIHDPHGFSFHCGKLDPALYLPQTD